MNIDVAQRGRVTVLTLQGALMKDTLDVLDAKFSDCVDGGVSLMVLDMERVPFIDSEGLERILDIVNQIGKRGGDIRVAALNAVCQDVFLVTLMEKFVQVCGDKETAVRELL